MVGIPAEDILLQAHIRNARDRFAKFRTSRQGWAKILNRENPVVLQAELQSTQEGIDYQTPDLKKAVRDHLSVLKMKPSTFDIISTAQDEQTKKDLRNVLLTVGRGWEYENEGRKVDRVLGEAQIKDGIGVARLHHYRQLEPNVDPTLPDADYLKEREKQLKKRRWPFHFTFPNIHGVAWVGDEEGEYGPDFFVYESEVPFLEAKETYKKEGKSLGYAGNKLGWFGRDDGQDEYNSDTWNGRTVKVTVVDRRKLADDKCPCGCECPPREILVYVCGDEEQVGEDHLFDSYDSPFPGCSFFVVGGDIRDERDPDKRFVPLIYEMYVEGEWTNYLTVEIATMARQDYAMRWYLDYSQSNPDFFKGDSGTLFQTTVNMDLSQMAEGEIPAFAGKLERPPSSISPHIVTLLQLHREAMVEYRPNRFAIGTANTEASNATATAYTQAQQQSRLPYSTLLSETDRFIVRKTRYELHALKYWHAFDPEGVDTPYTVPLTGNDSIVKFARETVKPGEVATITGGMLQELDFDIVVRTSSDTLQEEGERWLQGNDKYAKGAYTEEQWLRAAGHDDIEGQMEALDKLKIQRNFEPIQAQMDNAELVRIIEVGLGISFGGMFGGGGGAQAPTESPATNGAKSVGTAMGVPNNNILGRGGVQGPSGGSSPLVRSGA